MTKETNWTPELMLDCEQFCEGEHSPRVHSILDIIRACDQDLAEWENNSAIHY